MLSHFSRVRLCAMLWTAAHQASLSTGFSRQVLEWVAISICDQIKNSNNSFLLNVEVILKDNVNTQKKPT